MRNPEKGGIYDRLLLNMIDKAHIGEIMINFSCLIDEIKESESLAFEMVRSVLYKAEKIGMVHLTKRQFSDLKNVTYISLRFE